MRASENYSRLTWTRTNDKNVYLMTHSTHFFYGYMASDIWQRNFQIAREETHCRHYTGYYYRLAARDLLYAPSHLQDSTYHGLCYTSRGPLAGTKKYIIDITSDFARVLMKTDFEICLLIHETQRTDFVIVVSRGLSLVSL